jgi:KaiC/GvpD/RAD55 family RecA-like ATPase
MTDTEKAAMRSDRTALENALKDAGVQQWRGVSCKCPFHECHHFSAGIYVKDGVWKFKCQSAACGVNGDVFDVRAKTLGVDVGEVMKSLGTSNTQAVKLPKLFPSLDAIKGAIRGLEATYIYRNPASNDADLIVFRQVDAAGNKKFLQARQVLGGFTFGKPDGAMPIYNRARVAASDRVLVVEGEKCVHAVHATGCVATTSPGGAGKAKMADWSTLAGKHVYLWPDFDPVDEKSGKRTGYEHMHDVTACLARVTPRPRVFWIDPEQLDLPPKGDVADFLSRYPDADFTMAEKRDLLENEMENATPIIDRSVLSDFIEDVISGRITAIEFPWRILSAETNALMPGAIVLLCGDPGSTKSFAMMQASWHWYTNGVKVAVYELEEPMVHFQRRLLAQIERNGDLTDIGWIKRNPDAARAAVERHRDAINDFMASVWTREDDEPEISLDEIAQWIEDRAAAGAEIIIVDPVTCAAPTRDPWVSDHKFIMRVKGVLRDHQCRVILVTHPKKGRKNGSGLDEVAGGAAFTRFSQTVLWMEKLDTPELLSVRTALGTTTAEVNRRMQLRKTRNARGAGTAIGFRFDHSLTFRELGVIIQDETGGAQ